MRVKCLYCDVENDALATGGYCETCGKKLPSSAMVKTRKTLGGDMPESASEVVPLPQRTKAVSEGLYAAAVVYLVAGGMFLVVGSMLYGKGNVPEQFGSIVLTWTIVPTLFLGGLGLLARWMPMPAVWAAVGLAAAWVAVTFLLHVPLAAGWLLVDAVLFGVLAWVVWLGMRPDKRPGVG